MSSGHEMSTLNFPIPSSADEHPPFRRHTKGSNQTRIISCPIHVPQGDSQVSIVLCSPQESFSTASRPNMLQLLEDPQREWQGISSLGSIGFVLDFMLDGRPEKYLKLRAPASAEIKRRNRLDPKQSSKGHCN